MHATRLVAAVAVIGAVFGVGAGSALAEPPQRAGDAAFVCPTLNLPGAAVENSGTFGELGDTGQFTLAPGAAGDASTFNGNVPLHATNGEGAGTPGVDQVGPGDPGYTAIWSGS